MQLHTFTIGIFSIVGIAVVLFMIVKWCGVENNVRAGIIIATACLLSLYVFFRTAHVPNLREELTIWTDDVRNQNGLLVPENIHGTIRTDINLDRFLKYGYMSKQLRAAMEYQKVYGGTNPPPSVTASSQIIAPYSDVVIPVEPVLIPTAYNVQEPNELGLIPERIELATDTTTVSEPFVPILPADDQSKILLFYDPSCPHCREFMKVNGTWDAVKHKVKEERKIKHEIEFIEVNNHINPQLCREFNVAYYPCLMKIKHNNVYEFNDPRTYQNVLNFVLY